MIIQRFTYSDKSAVDLRVSITEGSDLFLILPAMGVYASYYDSLIDTLSKVGISSITADWRGNDSSSERPSKNLNFGYKELIGDIAELVAYVKREWPTKDLYLMGHSLGGQLGSLCQAKYPNSFRGIILVASCTVYYKNWNLGTQLKIITMGFLLKSINWLFGYFPGKIIGFGGSEARGVMKDWMSNAHTGKYIIEGEKDNFDALLSQQTLPLLCLTFEKDDLAVEAAVLELCNKFNNQKALTYRHVTLKESKIPLPSHFKWAKHPDNVVKICKDWLEEL